MSKKREGAGERLAVIDVGSNSVRMVVYEGSGRAPNHMFNEKALCGLGASIQRTRRLDPLGWDLALAAIRRYHSLCGDLGVTSIRSVATAAVREAVDGMRFVREVREATGIELRVASGSEEARLAAFGVLSGIPRAKGLAADLGGGSLELAEVGGGEVGETASLPIGPLRLGLPASQMRELSDEARRLLDGCALLKRGWNRLYLIGGSWRALARIHMNRVGYPLRVVHEYALERGEARSLCKWAAGQDAGSLAQHSDASASRLAVTPFGAMVLKRLLGRTRARGVVLSAFGLREGVFHDHLPPEVRAQDPLMVTCRDFEARLARFPGYGEELAEWVAPLFSDDTECERRLRRACCLVSDLEWREHPDYRADIAFESMMRVNLSGLNHAERTFMAGALWYRYRGGVVAVDALRSHALMDARALARAELLGRAMRLAEVLSGAATGILPQCSLSVDDDSVHLDLRQPRQALVSGAVERELRVVSAMMGRSGSLRACRD